MQCPARYRYEVIEGLRGGGSDSAYVQFHRCVYKTVGWMETKGEGKCVGPDAALGQFDAVWKESGPVKHPFEKYYRAAAENMVKGMTETVAREIGQYDRQDWAVPIAWAPCHDHSGSRGDLR